MSLQVIGPAGKGAKVVLWSESRVPPQTWQVDSFGRICSQMFEDKVLDVKGKIVAGLFFWGGGDWGRILIQEGVSETRKWQTYALHGSGTGIISRGHAHVQSS